MQEPFLQTPEYTYLQQYRSHSSYMQIWEPDQFRLIRYRHSIHNNADQASALIRRLRSIGSKIDTEFNPLTVTDYASAGKLWTKEDKIAAWIRNK